MICDGPDRVFLGVGPPAVPNRMRRDLADAGACRAEAPPSTAARRRVVARRERKSRRFTPKLYRFLPRDLVFFSVGFFSVGGRSRGAAPRSAAVAGLDSGGQV